MQTILLFVVVVAGVTTASDQPDKNSDNESSRTKRLLLDATLPTQMIAGFDFAKHLFSSMDKLDFGGVTGQMVGSLTSFLGAIGPFVGHALSLFSGHSPEFQLIRRLFRVVEIRFDQVDVQFAALRRRVAFVATQVHFTNLESNINAVHSEFTTLSRVTNSREYSSEKQEFIRIFDQTYEESGFKLFDIIIRGGALTGGLFHEFMTYSTYDRKQTQRFMIGTLNLLMRAAALEMTYAQLNNKSLDIKRRKWILAFTKLKNKMTAIDNEVKAHYHTQMVTDVNTFGTLHPKGSLSNSDFSSQLYNKLTTKVK